MNPQDASIASEIHAINASNVSQNLVTRISLKRNNYANAIIQRVSLYVRLNLLHPFNRHKVGQLYDLQCS